LVELRHDLHRHPELSLREVRTVERLHEEMSRIPLESLARVASTGIVARVAGRDRSAPVVAVRGDIDALPIREETGAEYASVNEGVMHACGHDVHAAWTVGAAALLTADRPLGDVVVLLQPGEETGHGAPLLIDAGALDGVAAIFGGHVDMRFEAGQVVAQEGNVAASADEFTIEVRGRGCHAGRPHEGRDPIVAAASLVTALQTIVSRGLPPGVAAVVTVGTIAGGTAANVIPDMVHLSGTVRAAEPRVRNLLHQDLDQVAHKVAEAHGVSAELTIEHGTPPLVNDPRCVSWAQRAATDLLGPDALRPLPEPNMGGEDFAHYLEHMPGAFVRIGARYPGESAIPAHTSRFLPADDAIHVGAAVLAETARRASEELGGQSLQ
jgi:hippurate hydrolase